MTTPLRPPALLIAGRGGIRDEAGAAAFREFVGELGRRHPELTVAGGLVGPSGALPADAVDELADRGARQVAVVPLTPDPAPGRPWRDLSAALAVERARRPGTEYVEGAAPGTRAALLSVLERRLDAALGGGARTPRDRAGVTVLLTGSGSTDPEVNAEAARAARLLWEGRGYAGVETAFVSSAAPDVPSGLDRCVRLGARRIVVLPYVLFEGAVTDRMRQHAEGWAAVHPEIDVVPAGTIGPAEELFDVVLEQYREAVAPTADADELLPAARQDQHHQQQDERNPQDRTDDHHAHAH